MHRFFVPPETLGPSITITGPLAHQMRRVLRLQPGEHVVLLDNSGWETEAEIVSCDEEAVQARPLRKTLGTGEPRTKITLYQSLLKGDHFTDVLQKCTQIGVVEFVPIVTERCIVGDAGDASNRYRRWQRVILEAAEQSRRSKLPALRPIVLLATALESVQVRGLSLIPWEEERRATLRTVLGPQQHTPPAKTTSRPGTMRPQPEPHRPFSINLFIGPEGGFTSNEIAIARHYGVIPISLGQRILRAETAGLVAASVILYALGDMG